MTKRSIASKKLWKLGINDFNTQYFDFNKEGDLIIKEGHNIYNVKYLAEKFGTSLEILMPFVIEERLEDFLDLTAALSKKVGYKGKFFYHYPMKVNQNKEFVLPAVAEGANLEVASANELERFKMSYSEKSGSVSAFSYVTVTDLTGRRVVRRVSHGRAHCVDLETAAAMVEAARSGEREQLPARSPSPFVHAEFKIAL